MNTLERISTTETMKFEGELADLVAEIVIGRDDIAIDAIVNELLSTRNKPAQSNYIKVLYEVGREAPELVAPYSMEFIKLLSSKNNRLVWGAMYALEATANNCLDTIIENIDSILSAMEKGSRITLDGGIKILAKLAASDEHKNVCFPLLEEKLMTCDIKKFPAYIEETIIIKDQEIISKLIKLIELRKSELDRPASIKRIDKVLMGFQKKCI